MPIDNKTRPPRACPLCATVTEATYCPTCRRVHIIARTMTSQQMRSKINTMRHSAGLYQKAINALEMAEAQP